MVQNFWTGFLFFLFATLEVRGQNFSVLVLGDWGTGSTGQNDVAAEMNTWAGQNNPQFILTCGDNFYPDGIEGSDDSRWEDYWNQVYTGENIRNLRWEVSLGNHDYRPLGLGYEWNQVSYTNVDPSGRWHLPHLWHSFYRSSSLGDIHFIIIDSEGIRQNMNDAEGQLQWLENELRGSRGAMKIVVAHHPVYSAGRHGPVDLTIEAEVLSLMEQHGVDIYLVGHDHNLQHLRDISDENDFLEEIVSGGGGRGLYAEEPINRGILESMGITVEAFFETHGFTGLTVVNGELRIEYRNDDGELIYDLRKAPRTRSRVVPVPRWKDPYTIRHI